MQYMETSTGISKKKRGQQLVIAERNVLVAKMLEKLLEGYISTNKLSKELNVSRQTVDSYRPLVDQIIRDTVIDRNVIRNLQIQRTYKMIEMLMNDLTGTKDPKQRVGYYSQIFKFSSHLALITGLNVETHVNVDPTKLVIIRSKTRAAKSVEPVNELPSLESQDSNIQVSPEVV